MRSGPFLALAVAAGAAIGVSSPTRRVDRPVSPPQAPATAVADVVLTPIAGPLTSITGITHAGDGRLFLTLQSGRILVRENGAILPTPFLDISPLVVCCGEQGLLSTAFHPSYASNGFFFVNYTDNAGDTVVARYRVSGNRNVADAASGVILLTVDQPFANHNGGQLQFGPDGFLYIGMGDGGSGNDPLCFAQRGDPQPGRQDLLGKLLRIDVNQNVDTPPFYGIPPENPFAATTGPDEAWAFGVRNPWRFSFDRLTGDMYVGDVGQGEREEIDFQPVSSRGGENYGWKLMEGFRCTGDSGNCPEGTPPCNDPRYTLPILDYDHDGHCSVTGGYVYRGLSIPDLYGAYVYGDFCSGTIWAATRSASSWATAVLPVEAPSLTTFGEDAAGELYVGANNGTLYLVQPAVISSPVVATITPATGFERGGAAVSITGANFTGQTEVLFGTLPAEVTVSSPTSLTAVAPTHPAGVVDITVSNPGAPPAVREDAFSYVEIPRVAPPSGTRVIERP